MRSRIIINENTENWKIYFLPATLSVKKHQDTYKIQRSILNVIIATNAVYVARTFYNPESHLAIAKSHRYVNLSRRNVFRCIFADKSGAYLWKGRAKEGRRG